MLGFLGTGPPLAVTCQEEVFEDCRDLVQSAADGRRAQTSDGRTSEIVHRRRGRMRHGVLPDGNGVEIALCVLERIVFFFVFPPRLHLECDFCDGNQKRNETGMPDQGI